MADITLCNDHECPMSDYCYRHEAPPNGQSQPYFTKSPRVGEMCDFYWPLEDEDD